jgi:SecD/SecF fusion protein
MSSFFDITNFLFGQATPMGSWSKLGLLACMAVAAFVSRIVARKLAEQLRRPEMAGQWTMYLMLLSVAAVFTSWMGWIVDLWPLWAVIVVGIVGYLMAPQLPHSISVRQKGWYFTLALVLAAVGAIFIVPSDYENKPAVITMAVLLLSVCVPYLFAKLLGERLRAPEFVWRLTFVLTTVCVAVFVVMPKPAEYGVGWPPKYGVDLQGGVNLIYQFEMDPGGGSDGGRPMTRSEIQSALVGELSKRINPSGTSDIVVRPYGTSQVEIIVPEVNQDEVFVIKKLITTAGSLEFRIVANNRQHSLLVTDLVKDPRNKQQDIVYDFDEDGGKTEYGRWAQVAREDVEVEGKIRRFKYNPVGDVIRDIDTRDLLTLGPDVTLSDSPETDLAKYLDDEGIRDIEVLVYTGADDPLVTGEGLGAVSAGYENLNPMVNFSLKQAKGAASKFAKLTFRNQPEKDTNRTSKLGILLDGKLLSAPSIQSQITGRGQITGKFTQEEVDFLVEILRAGKLSTVLQKEPISENTMGAELGQSTINKGKWAIQLSLVCVLAFVWFYYRFAGMVACLALILNLLLVLAFMILIKAAFTLPGLAGLILTVGMSVDANVLIFERIREELGRGARLRMAIRNGFSRATTTIVDANLTTLITAIVLYAIGTDQIRGFAVTLILGILMSMYTAIFCSRIVFELAERTRNFTSLRMRRIVGETKIDFVGKRLWAGVLSLVLIVVGLTAVWARGEDIFDIDFLGGTALTMQLKNGLSVDDMEEECRKAFVTRRIVNGKLIKGTKKGAKVHYTLNALEIDGIQKETVWKLVTSVPKSKDLQDLVQEKFAGKLMSYSVTVRAVRPVLDDSEPPTESPIETPPSGAAGPSRQDQLTGPFFVSVTEEQEEKTGAQVASEQAEEKESGDKKSPPADSPQLPVLPDAEESTPAAVPALARTAVELVFGEPPVAGTEPETAAKTASDGMAGFTLHDKIKSAAENMTEPIMLSDSAIVVRPLDKDRDPKWNMESGARYHEWEVTLNRDQQVTERILQQLDDDLANTPVFHSSNTIGGKVAGDTQRLAIFAMLTSLLGIIGYIWIRFQRVVYGLAAVVALIHDVLITLGAIALSFYLAGSLGFLKIEEFSISLPIVAAFLTIVGYSLNDTIVVFDRIREVRGKSPDLTETMINQSINQTLSRTVLTSLTTLIVVAILYWFGGQGIHGFAYALVVGVMVGTYSSVFVASPALLWLSKPRS